MITRPSFRILISLRARALAPTVALALAALVAACASGRDIVPVGGPPDTTAPRVVSTDPPNGTLNFRGDEVTIVFSESMQEGQAASNVVITPIPARQPELDWSGKKLTIEFREPLVENRTYAITVGSGLTDIASPANRLGQPYTLRFSTGSTIDSGVVRGQVLGAARRRAYVFAWRVEPGAPDTLRPEMTRPDFIAPVADDGRFALEGLPPGRVRMIVVTDEFGDQLYNPGTDAFGVGPSSILIDSAYTPVGGISIRLAPAPLDLVPPSLYSVRSIDRSTTELRFNEPIDTTSLRSGAISIEGGGGAVAVREAWRSTSNWMAVIVAHEPLPGTNATVQVRAVRDTAGNVIVDSTGRGTFTIADAVDTIAPAIAILSVDSARAYSWPDSIAIGFSEAVRTSDLAGAVALRDTLGRTLRFGMRRISAAQFLAWPIDTLAGAARGTLEIDLGRFSDLAGNRADSVARIRIPVGAVRQAGSISGTLVDSAAPGASHVILAQLVGTTRTFRRVVRSGSWEMPSVPEGDYRITAFRDDNGNGAHDFGSLSPWSPPESLIEWSGNVRVRPRWATSKVDLVFGG
jgi:hypothetical protein